MASMSLPHFEIDSATVAGGGVSASPKAPSDEPTYFLSA